MKQGPGYWCERVLLDELADAQQWLAKLALATDGEPKHFPYAQATDRMIALRIELEEQLQAAGKNGYYAQAQKG